MRMEYMSTDVPRNALKINTKTMQKQPQFH